MAQPSPSSAPASSDGAQGRRSDIPLLDEDGAITERFERVLGHIFSKYIAKPPTPDPTDGFRTPPKDAVLTSEGLDQYAIETNGKPFPEETKQELRDFLDVDDDGNLTFEGFVQIYQLQTENEEEETWRDLATHGFDRQLQLVTTRRNELVDEVSPVPKSELGGLGMGGEVASEPLTKSS